MVYCYANSSTTLYMRCSSCEYRFLHTPQLPPQEPGTPPISASALMRHLAEGWRRKRGGAPLTCPSCNEQPPDHGSTLLELLNGTTDKPDSVHSGDEHGE